MTTSFRNIFRQQAVSHIEIPIIQRDYAQGRTDAGVKRIRRAFLKVLYEALTGGKDKAVRLDFVYGEVQGGRMIPLDGQQRLTTLFLLHWYLAARSGAAGEECVFLGYFTYKTRFSARHFCEKLIAQRPPFASIQQDGVKGLSKWLVDQHWYAGAWKHDPTIQSMLVALDDINALFASLDEAGCRAAWDRLLVEPEAEVEPAITFDYLSLENLALGHADEQYIKMNSRGKPLTPFEHFKADFEKTLGAVSKESRDHFSRRIDQEWSDLLWPLRDSNSKNANDSNIIDDEFLRLFNFIGDVIVSRNGLPVDPDMFKEDIDDWAEKIFGPENVNHLAAHRYLFTALDSFVSEFGKMKKAADFADWFAGYFTETGHREGAVAIFGEVDLFGACCADYGSRQGDSRRAFTLSRILLFFAVLEYLMLEQRPPRAEINRRLRTLRNLIYASNDEIRPKNFPALLNETAEYIGSGDRSKLDTYNKRQIVEEELKERLLEKNPGNAALQDALHRLEDHELLRGCLAAFDLGVDAATFIRRAENFLEIFPDGGSPPWKGIAAALLASGDYSQHPRHDRYQFGSPERGRVWYDLFTGKDIKGTKAALAQLLDDFGEKVGASVEERLQAVTDDFLTRQMGSMSLDWRYYLVKYPEMRRGPSGIYASYHGVMGFDVCMMKETQLNGAYYDPYLLAVIRRSGAQVGKDVTELRYFGWDFYKPEDRWIEFAGTTERVMSCREYGFELREPSDATHLAVFRTICKKYKVEDDLTLRVPQRTVDGVTYDEKDRIEAAAAFLKELVSAVNSTESMSAPDAALFAEYHYPASV